MQLVSKQMMEHLTLISVRKMQIKTVTLSPLFCSIRWENFAQPSVGKGMGKCTSIEQIVMVSLVVPIVILSMHILRKSDFTSRSLPQ